MIEELEGRDLLLWASFKREADELRLEGPDEVIDLAVRLIADWGSNRPDMRRVLSQGACRGELSAEVLLKWDARWADAGTSLPDAESAAQGALPAELLPFERAIGECSRRQGHLALELGRQLLAARARCEACGYRFESFLAHVRRHHALNRATCYMYVKFAEWELPDSLGTAVMKWIVQGFERGSADAGRVIRAAVTEGLTLEALKSSYGRLRRARTAAKQQAGAPSALTLREELIKERERLLVLRAQLDEELSVLESRLKSLDPEAPSEPVVSHAATEPSPDDVTTPARAGRGRIR